MAESQNKKGTTGAQGEQGAAGDSAYQVAVNNGFVGNEAAWLASLVGEAGATGESGSNGAAGLDGASAYEIAVANGFVGDESAWLASLVGATGAQGVQGIQGEQGIQGIQGEAGTNGTDATPAHGIPFGMSGSAISTGAKREITCTYPFTITRVSLRAKETGGSMVLDIKKNGTSICAAAKPTLTAAKTYDDSTLTGWTLTFIAGDILSYNVDSISGITEFDNMLWVNKT